MPDEDSLLAEARQRIQLSIPKEEFRVFVFGPGMDPTDVVASPTSDVTTQPGLVEHAKYLRFLTAQKLKKDGWTVDFGETKSIQKFWASLGFKNFAAMEYTHAKKFCGAIIIFPASVGAICELSLFANSSQLAEKTVAIVHSEYENHQSFFRVGILKLLRARRGRIEFEDYQDFESCAKHAIEFVEDQWTNFSLEDDAINDGNLLAQKRKGTSFEKAK